MRHAFSDALVALAKANPDVMLLTGDHGYALFDDFIRECPDQYINAGIAEQNMVGVAAGLARSGFRPIVYGLSAFVPIRVLEQIKLDVAHDRLPVIFIGDGAGFVYSHLGTSHQSTEDVACARAIPNLSVYSPADANEMTLCMEEAYRANSSVYLRMGKSDRGTVHEGRLLKTQPGSLLRVRDGDSKELVFVATGSMVRTAIDVATRGFPDVAVWSCPFIKPINHQQVASICGNYHNVVVLEEHSVHGGLGSVIAEICGELAPTRILRVGVQDRFSHYCGSYAYLLAEHGLDDASVTQKIGQFVAGRVSGCV